VPLAVINEPQFARLPEQRASAAVDVVGDKADTNRDAAPVSVIGASPYFVSEHDVALAELRKNFKTQMFCSKIPL
jgi:hypothetical protein